MSRASRRDPSGGPDNPAARRTASVEFGPPSAGIDSASTGQAGRQAPQPVQPAGSMLIAPPRPPAIARSGQRATQITQTTPLAARQLAASSSTAGNARAGVAAGASGQASTQASQNAQGPVSKSS